MPANFRKAAITGAAISQVGRRLNRSGLDLTIEATLRALDRAGLSPADIDGVTTWPAVQPNRLAVSPVTVMEVKEALGLKLNWFLSGAEAAGQLSPVIMAAMAVITGQARHVLVYRTLTEATAAQQSQHRPGFSDVNAGRVGGWQQWLAPFGALSAANWIAQMAQRRFHEFGLTREQLAQVALNARRHAALNPDAIFRTPLSLDDYLSSRMISTPLCLYDCDTATDGSVAIIISRTEEARDMLNPPLIIEAASGAHHGRDSWDQVEDLTMMAAADAARDMWRQTDLTPADVDVAQLYDGFSVLTLMWLEAMGFCGRGESGAFVENGTNIGRDGRLPLNTGGGQLSGGRLHGLGFLYEAAIQLWGLGGARQIVNDPRVAAVGTGGGPLASCLLLVRED